MAEEESEEKTINSNDFDVESELNILVKNKILPKVIAEKLAKKIQEKNIKITKEQLILLAEKVNEFIKSYKEQLKQKENRSEKEIQIEDDEQTEKTLENHDLKELFDKINDLQQQIDLLTSKSDIPKEAIQQLYNDTEKSTNTETTSLQDIDIPGVRVTVPFHDDILVELPNDPESIIVVMNWLQYLIDKCGYENLSNILDYYVDIEWITDDVKISLIDYSRGIQEEKTSTNGKNDTKKEVQQLPSTNHIQSYMYIQKLKGKQFDKHFVDRVQSQLSRIKKKVDQFQQNEINQ
jgi:archaeal flagellar protein FlaD